MALSEQVRKVQLHYTATIVSEYGPHAEHGPIAAMDPRALEGVKVALSDATSGTVRRVSYEGCEAAVDSGTTHGKTHRWRLDIDVDTFIQVSAR